MNTPIKELNQIVVDIVKAGSHAVQMEAGKKLFAYTIRKDVDEELRAFAENIAMLMIQKEGQELHLKFMNEDLQKVGEDLLQAKHDPLTGLPNRGLFYETLTTSFETAKAENKLLSLILLDLDKFKPVNDTYGHDAGDRLLKEVATRINKVVGKSGFPARLGGDEFVILLLNLPGEKEVFTIAQKLLLSLKQPFLLGSSTIFIDSSIGVSFLEKTTSGPRVLLKNADQAMYLAKKTGRGRYVAHKSSG